jgi:subtilisin-like proprotein convertase family protein
MDSRHGIKRIAAVVTLAIWLSNPVSAVIHTFGDQFNLPIPEDSGQSRGWMSDAVINVTEHIIISDIDIEINIAHTSAFDLQLFLQNPAGTSVLLNFYNFHDFFEGADYIRTIFDDEADLSIEQAHSPFTGRFRPRSPELLSIFDGQDAFGRWHLRIYDAYYADIGTLENAQLLIITPEPATAILLCLGITILIKIRSRVRVYG